MHINLKEKPEWLEEIHPDKKVPALEHDGKVVILSCKTLMLLVNVTKI